MSRYLPHQGKQEKARRCRQMGISIPVITHEISDVPIPTIKVSRWKKLLMWFKRR